MDPEAPEGRRSGGGSQQEGHCKGKELIRNSPSHFHSFLEKILVIPACCKLGNSFYLFFKNPENHLDRGGGHVQKLKRSKVSDVADTRERFFERALPAPVLPPYHQGNGGSCPLCPRASAALVWIHPCTKIELQKAV